TPTLVLAGGDDRPDFTGAGQYLERKMPDARVVVLEGGGHSMHESSHANEVAELVADFIDALDKP
ncbi:MAG: alpha/beta hydrolase, partial [Ilumatobacteraceae bacterium]|nr:alpha/beta hydrolase [Ilumatobacteraceae bacterium]